MMNKNELSQPPPRQFTPFEKQEFAGRGNGLQAFGVLVAISPLLFGRVAMTVVGWTVALVLALILIVAGSMQSSSWRCGGCRERIEDDAEVCPHCRSDVDWESIC